MCGRVAIFTPPERIARFLQASLDAGLSLTGQASWNLGPTRSILGVSADSGQRILSTYRWGLVPSWAKDSSAMSKTFNARAETVADKPSFRSSFAKQRILIPIDGFYEWKREGSSKQAWYFQRADGNPLVLAGLGASWSDPAVAGSPVLHSASMITTDAQGSDLEAIHHRVPVVLELEDCERWLKSEDPAEAQALLQASSLGTMIGHEVDKRVGNVRNDDATLIDPVPPETLF